MAGIVRRVHLVLQRSVDPDTFPPLLTLPSMTHIAGSGGFPVARAGRWLLVGWSLFLLGGFALAYALEPDPRGFGTHQSLGLPPCTFRALFGIPCPSCGMTTSFSHFMHGNLWQAFRANAGGGAVGGRVPGADSVVLVERFSRPSGRRFGSLRGAWCGCSLRSRGVCLVNWVMQLMQG